MKEDIERYGSSICVIRSCTDVDILQQTRKNIKAELNLESIYQFIDKTIDNTINDVKH